MKVELFIYALIILLVVICCYIIGCVGLEWFPYIGTISNPNLINNTLLNLSYSYLAAFIFYIFITVLPYRLKRRKFRVVVKNMLLIIKGKLDMCNHEFLPITEQNKILSHSEIIERWQNTDISISPSPFNALGSRMTILESLNQQKKEIIEIIVDIKDYKDYLTTTELLDIEKIKNDDYFQVLKAFSFTAVNKFPNIRKSCAELMIKLQTFLDKFIKQF